MKVSKEIRKQLIMEGLRLKEAGRLKYGIIYKELGVKYGLQSVSVRNIILNAEKQNLL